MKDELLQLILDRITTTAELDAFFTDLLTPKEYRDLVLRYQLCKELATGKTVREISEELNIAPARVVRGNRLLKYDSKIVKTWLKE